jgi:hypothetical protein
MALIYHDKTGTVQWVHAPEVKQFALQDPRPEWTSLVVKDEELLMKMQELGHWNFRVEKGKIVPITQEG